MGTDKPLEQPCFEASGAKSEYCLENSIDFPKKCINILEEIMICLQISLDICAVVCEKCMFLNEYSEEIICFA